MRKVKFEGWIIFDEEENSYGNNIVAQIGHELFNVDGVMKWEFTELENEEIEYEEEEK